MKACMAPICFLLLLFTPSTLPAQAATSLSAKSRKDAVTVFSDRAQITRSASLSLKSGANLVAFENLPRLVAEDSLRAVGKGTGRARIAGITVKSVFLERAQEKRVRELEEEIAALSRKVESIEARRKALISQRAFIDSIRVGWGERISKELSLGKPTTAELGEAVKFVGEGVGKVEEQLYDADAAKKPLTERMAALKKELEQNRGDRLKEVRSVLVAIEADRDMKFDLDLSYLVGQASWEPAYDVRLAAQGKEAELAYRAQVRQKTGEDRSAVKLSLSTATPEAGGGAPELVPWHISLYEPPRPLPYASRARKDAPAPAPMTGGAMESLGRMELPADQMEQAFPITSEVAQGQTSVLFHVAQPVDIPADGTRSGSIIAVEKVPVTAEYVTVPKLSQRVYLKSVVTNKTPYPLLAGEVNIFNDEVYAGKSHLKTVSSGEEFDLYFGADDQIKVKRDLVKVRKKAGLLGGNSVSYNVTVELENFKNRALAVSLLDQLPLPGNAEIRVNLENPTPRPGETREDGTIVWKIELASGEKKKISYDIVIDYPKGRELAGDF